MQGKPFKVAELESPGSQEASDGDRDDDARSTVQADADEEGLPDRPGSALVPGLRRLRDPRRGAEG